MRISHPSWSKGQALRICQDCYENKPRCKSCQMPIAAPSPHGLCKTCATSLKICLSCGQAIKGQYLQIDGVEPYCLACYKNRPKCDVCSSPLTDQHWQLSDGRLSCFYCHTAAVYTPAEARAIYEDIQRLAAINLGMSLNVPTGLALVDRNQLAEIIRKQGDGTAALDPQHTLGVFARRGMRRAIYVQTGLPRKLLQQIGAHEFAHAWQGENCPLLREPVLHEGFAEWVAYQVIGVYGYTHQQERMLARQDIYGQGLRWALNIQERTGIAGLLEACRRMH